MIVRINQTKKTKRKYTVDVLLFYLALNVQKSQCQRKQEHTEIGNEFFLNVE